MNSVTGTETIFLKVLGQFEARDSAGNLIIISGRKNQALLAALALAPSCSLMRARIVNLLWSDRGEDQGRTSLRQSLAALRKELGEVGTKLLSSGDERVRLSVSSSAGNFQLRNNSKTMIVELGGTNNENGTINTYNSGGTFVQGIGSSN